MSNAMLKLQILARSEMALAQLRAQRAGSRSVLFTVALVFGLLALGMLNLAGYQALTPRLGAALAALVVSVADLATAVVIVLVARHAGPDEDDEKLAREMRDLAYAELGADLERVKAEIRQVTDDVRGIRSSFTSIAGGAASTLGPLVGLLINTLKKKKEQA